MRLRGIILAVLGFGSIVGCTSQELQKCQIDSDCSSGLICARDGVCRASDDPLHKAQTDLGSTPVLDAEGGDLCVTQSDFGTGGGECPSKTTVLKLTKLVILKEGGLGNISSAANPTIASDMEAGKIHVELWDDTVWVPIDADGTPMCSQIEANTFPMTVPTFPVRSAVKDATLDATKTKLTGWVNKHDMIQTMKCELHAAADTLVKEDIDSDGDGVNDRVSVVLEIELAP